MSRRPDAEVRRARRAAREIIAHHLGEGTHRVCARSGGATNHVYEVVHPEGAFIVRLSLDPAKIHNFPEGTMGDKPDAGVPVPEVSRSATSRARSSTWSRSSHTARRRRTIRSGSKCWNSSARSRRASTASRPTATAARSTGRRTSCRAARRDDYLDHELGLEARLETLAKHGGIENGRLRRMRARLREIGTLAGGPRLNHGDLRLKNVLVGIDGSITALIDWEFATSNAVPFWDTSLALHDLSIDEKHAYLAGYGLEEARLGEIAPYLKALNLLNYAPYVQRAAEAGDAVQLERSAYASRAHSTCIRCNPPSGTMRPAQGPVSREAPMNSVLWVRRAGPARGVERPGGWIRDCQRGFIALVEISKLRRALRCAHADLGRELEHPPASSRS